MAAPTVTVISATTSASATGTGTLAANGVNKFAVMVTGVDLRTVANELPTLSFVFSISYDGVTFQSVEPYVWRGNTALFDVPALAVQATFGGNAAGKSIAVTAYAQTD